MSKRNHNFFFYCCCCFPLLLAWLSFIHPYHLLYSLRNHNNNISSLLNGTVKYVGHSVRNVMLYILCDVHEYELRATTICNKYNKCVRAGMQQFIQFAMGKLFPVTDSRLVSTEICSCYCCCCWYWHRHCHCHCCCSLVFRLHFSNCVPLNRWRRQQLCRWRRPRRRRYIVWFTKDSGKANNTCVVSFSPRPLNNTEYDH